MAKIANIQEVSLTKLKPYKNNAKIHGKEQVQKIAESIKAFGFLSPCLIDEEMNLIAGHGRVMAAKELGMESVPCLFIEGLSEEQRKAYILADNKLTEMGDWDVNLVSQELEDLKEQGFDIDLTGFSVDDILFDDEEIYLPEAEDEDEDEPEPRIKRGEVWQLGRHRLMCGDSTSWEDVEKLTQGQQMDLLETDPPYNVAVKSSKGETIENDNLRNDEFYTFLLKTFSNAKEALKEGGAYYVWHADSNGHLFRNALDEVGLPIRQNLIWVKNGFTLGRQDYQWKHEPCLYGWKEGAGHYFIDMRSLPTVEEFSNLEKNRERNSLKC